MAKEIKSVEEFESTVEKGKVLVDFWAPWCGPCQMQGPILEEFAQKHSEVNVVKVNVDELPELAGKFGVMSIPTLIFFENGVEKNKRIGVQSVEALEEMIGG